jgi:hypothetical protein
MNTTRLMVAIGAAALTIILGCFLIWALRLGGFQC